MTSTISVLASAALLAGALSDAERPVLKEGPYVGTVELTETLVGPLETERLVARPAVDGRLVESGEVLARLDATLLEAEAARLAAQLAAREARLRELTAGFRSEEIREARGRKQAAEARFDLARTERARAERLLESGAGSRAAVDRARSEEETAARELDSLSARLALLEAGERSEQRDQAREDVESSRHALQVMRERIARLTLTAPAAGVVLDTYYEPGEIVPTGRPVVKLGDAASPYVDIYVAPADLAALRIGSELPVRVDGFPDRAFTGRVIELGTEAEFTPRAILTPRERARLVYRVRVSLAGAGAALRPGVPAEVAGP